MKFILFFVFLVFYNQINYSCSYYSYVYSIEQIYKILNNIKAEESDLKIIVDSFISLFNEAYAYTEIAKNPPQPDFNSSYYEKVDIEKGLRNIQIKDTNMFKFYKELKLLFDKLGDQHLHINLDTKLKYLYFVSPIKLVLKKYEEEYRIFGDAYPISSDYHYFRNNEEVFNMINRNKNVPIIKINGKDPFDYVTEFGGSYEKFKSPQGTFRFKFYEQQVKTRNFFDYPLSPEEFYNFTVEYRNGDKFTTDFVIYSTYNLSQNAFNNEIKSFAENIRKKKEVNMTEIYKDIITFGSKKLFDKLYSNEKINKSNFADSMEWDKSYSYEIACKVDKTRKINIYGVLSFGTSSSSGYMDTIVDCINLFDENNYPIIVVNILNGGGLVDNSQFLIETVSPKTTVNIYSAYRDNGLYKDTSISNQLIGNFLDIESCESLSYRAFKKKSKSIDYGNSVNDKILGPFFFNGKNIRRKINMIKEELKNPRKPTDIILFTDGFSYSATSVFLKFLQYYGGGITVGYYPYPNLGKIPYDSGLSPSSIFTQDTLKLLDASGLSNLQKYKFDFILTVSQAFYEPSDFKHPLEYVVTPVDEKVNIYINDTESGYDRMYRKENFDAFIEEALLIIEKYKTNCNPNNKKLVLVTNECDGKFENSYTHGGYVCGNNGLWTKECVASYCDVGYIFDHINRKCIVDVCRPEDVGRKFLIIIIVIMVILVGTIIGFVICCIVYNKKKQLRLKQFNTNNLGLINDNQNEDKTDD